MSDCTHPPARLYLGFARDPVTARFKPWIACCDCGAVLHGGAELVRGT